MSQFGEVMSSEPFSQKVVNELNGDLLCEDPNLALDGDQIRDCKIFTKTFGTPEILPLCECSR